MSPPSSLARALSKAIAAVTLGVIALACSRPGAEREKGEGRPKEVVFPVEVRPVERRRVDYTVKAVGALEAFENVQVTARVGGAVERLHFKEGDVVKKGALLAEVEPERYQLALQSAKAAVERAEAARAEAERELERAEKLAAEGISTGAVVNTWQTRLQTAGAETSQAKAALGVASLNLRDARLRAPIAGSIQSRNVETGQYVQPGAVIATLIRRDPLLLRFKVTEAEAGRVTPGMKARFSVSGSQTSHEATVTFVSGAAEAASRMVPVVAEATDHAELRPGAFAEVTIPVGSNDAALAVPETAIRPSERGFIAFVAEGGVAHERVLELGLRTPEGLVEVKKGLSAGEPLVVRGGEALKEGAKVKIGGTRPGGSSEPRGAPATSAGPKVGASP